MEVKELLYDLSRSIDVSVEDFEEFFAVREDCYKNWMEGRISDAWKNFFLMLLLYSQKAYVCDQCLCESKPIAVRFGNYVNLCCDCCGEPVLKIRIPEECHEA